MRRRNPSFAPSSSRLTAVMGACLVSLCAVSAASAAQPAAPAPAAAPTTTTEVTAPAGHPVVIVNTTVPAAAAAAAAAPAPAPAPAAAPAQPSWNVPVQPAPTPAATVPSRIAVDFHPHPIAPPTPAQQANSRKQAEISRARGLMIAGWSILGTTYGVTALTGTIAIDTAGSDRMRHYGYWMTIPVVGPFAAAFNSRTATGALLTTSLGLAQVAGLGMALVGGVRHRRLKRELTFTAMPTRGGGQVGLSMRF
jgi:hypothetical protein